jgi:hypothetical protein
VLRAADAVASRLGNWEKWKCEWFGDDLTDRGAVFVNVCDVQSYALGRLRIEAPSIAAGKLRDPQKLMRRGGAWWAHVQ